jgi:TonB family protein
MILKCLNSILAITIVLSFGLAEAISGQQESWQRIAPVGYSFTILMPTKSISAFRRIPVSDKDSIPVNVYSSVNRGKRYVVAAFLKTSSDAVPALSAYQKFIVAMEYSFKGDGMAKTLTFKRDLSLDGVTGKQYRLELGTYPGVAQFLEVAEAYYALVVIGAEESDSEVARFLSSFQPGQLNTNPESSGVSVGVVTMIGSASDAANSSKMTPSSGSIDTQPPEPWPLPVGSITGGVLNGRAISLSVPKYPKEARKAHDSGQVRVQVLIDERGVVISAKAIEGPDSLREAAVSAALQSRFTPTRLMGQPVKVNGVIIYNFVAQ